MTEKPNKIWFELELPENYDDQKGRNIAEKACLVLKHMGVDYNVPVWWNTTKKCYCFSIDSAGCYVEANDHGHWYNLDYLAKKGRK